MLPQDIVTHRNCPPLITDGLWSRRHGPPEQVSSYVDMPPFIWFPPRRWEICTLGCGPRHSGTFSNRQRDSTLWLPFLLEENSRQPRWKAVCWADVQTSSSPLGFQAWALWGAGDSSGNCEDGEGVSSRRWLGLGLQRLRENPVQLSGLRSLCCSLYYAAWFLTCYCWTK